MDAIFQSVWEMSLFAIPVILVLALCSKFLGKRYGAKWRYLLWLVVAVRLCIPVQLSLPDFMMGMRMEVPSVQNAAREMLAERTELYVIEETTMEPVSVDTILAEDGAQPPAVNLDANSSYQNPVDFFLAYPDMLWMLGVLLFLGWQGWKYFSFKKMLQRNRRKVLDAAVLDIYYTLCKNMGISTRPEIYFCGGLPSPLCVGFFKPAIYINSEDREEGDLRLILQHELTHCKREDLWYKGILMLARAMHFFNPFVHWMAKLAEKDMELSCDLAVMENCNMEEREAYSMAILRTVKKANSKNMGMSTAFSGGKEELKARFENIFDMTAKKRGIALFTAAALLVCGGAAFVGCRAPEPKEEQETRVVYGGYTERIVKDLYGAKLQYIGDHVGVGKIMSLLPLPDGVTPNEEGMELFTTEEPYGARRYLNWESTGETVYKLDRENYQDNRWNLIHGMIFLALVDNADYLEYGWKMNVIEEDKNTGMATVFGQFSREDAKFYFGEMDLREFAKDEKTFLNFVSAINRYYYEGIRTPEEIYALMHMDDEAAQTRMNDMLYGGEKAELNSDMGIEGESMSYQMIVANTLVYEIASEQGLTSSNPLDYINCAEYEELVKIGEPALREFLAAFAEGRAGNGLEAYIMMFACQDILGEPRQTDLTPTEWYRYYSMLDSALAVPFRYDAVVYTSALEKEYSLNMPSAEKDSIIAAGKDQRIKAVYDVLDANLNKGMSLGHKVTFYAPQIFHIEEMDDTMSIFAMIFDSTYALSRTKTGYGFFERGGSMIPSRMDFERINGTWVLTKWTQAEDGSNYASSIKKMCKDVKNSKTLANKLISNSAGNVHMLMWQNIIYYMNAHYGGMDIPVYVSSYTDEDTLAKVGKYIRVVPMFE